jgi:uncharacterized protein (DUF58 family)
MSPISDYRPNHRQKVAMGLSFAAMGRSTGPRRTREASSSSRYAVYTSVADLVAMHAAARDLGPPPRQPVQGLLSARRAGQFRGDDEAGAMDWPRTPGADRSARRVRGADQERPALIVVDQRLDMFFGSRRSMKSVAAAEAAALCAWRLLDGGAPVGGVVFNDATIETARPDCSIGAAMRLIEAIASQNAELSADSTHPRAPGQLDAALKAAASLAAQDHLQDHLIIVISDFHGHGPRTRELLINLAARNDVLAIQVYDPFLIDLPKTGAIIITGGELQIDLDFGGGRIRRSLYEFAEAPGKEFLAFEREIGVPVLPLSAAEETAPQIRRLLDRPPWRRIDA